MAESIFTAQTPASPNVVEPGGITGGTTFIPAVDGVVSAVRFYASSDIGGTYTGSLYLPTSDDDPEGSGTGTLLSSGALAGAATPSAWNVIAITPVNVTAGTAYRVAMHNSAGHYVSTPAFASFASGGLTNGNLFAPPSGYDIGIGTIAQGTFNVNGAPLYPSNTFNTGCYFVDVVFTATADVAEGSVSSTITLTLATTGEAPEVTPNEGVSALTIDYTISAVGVTPDPEPDTGALCGWDIDPAALGVCSDWADYPEGTQETALQLSYLFLWAATGRRYGICPITVRPSQPKCTPVQYQAYPVWPGQGSGDGYPSGPYLFGGQWFNGDCGSCCNSAGCSIVLRGPVAEVTEVLVDGETISSSTYRVDVSRGAYLLVRTDGSCWPSCQNMTASTSEDNTFSVTYGYGRVIPIALRVAAAMLACEYAKGITGGPCKLPARMTRLSRQGIDVEVEAVDAAVGTTGLKEVDDVVTALNPGRLKSPPVVLSLDLPEYGDRFTVWGA